jgi:hypothetical protein
MNLRANNIRLQYTESGKVEIILSTDANRLDISEYKAIVAKGKMLDVKIKQYRKARSLNANSYAWVLIGKMAEVMSRDKGHIYSPDEIYIEMLKRYGQREPKLLSIIADGVDIIYRATENHCCEVGESELNGKVFKHLAILRGSSGYDTKEMSQLIDGIVQECKELDIETMTPAEIESMKQEWGREKNYVI